MVLECGHEPKESKNKKAFECQNGCHFLQRRQTANMHKMLNVISHYRNASQKHNVISLHFTSSRMALIKKQKQKVSSIGEDVEDVLLVAM